MYQWWSETCKQKCVLNDSVQTGQRSLYLRSLNQCCDYKLNPLSLFNTQTPQVITVQLIDSVISLIRFCNLHVNYVYTIIPSAIIIGFSFLFKFHTLCFSCFITLTMMPTSSMLNRSGPSRHLHLL